jgi:putative PIN family toxin of toxin-antitoxin system
MLRAVLDTNVLVAGLRSPSGASNEVLRQLRAGRWRMLVSNHLLFEYEEVAKRHAAEIPLALADIDDVLDAFCRAAEPHTLRPGWPPQLSDPDDEPLLQLAVEGGADGIITHNTRHLQPAERFGILVLTPAQFLAQLKKTT